MFTGSSLPAPISLATPLGRRAASRFSLLGLSWVTSPALNPSLSQKVENMYVCQSWYSCEHHVEEQQKRDTPPGENGGWPRRTGEWRTDGIRQQRARAQKGEDFLSGEARFQQHSAASRLWSPALPIHLPALGWPTSFLFCPLSRQPGAQRKSQFSANTENGWSSPTLLWTAFLHSFALVFPSLFQVCCQGKPCH